MKLFQTLSAIALAVVLAACATKAAPHKLTAPAPGDGSAPSISSW
jgi:hypothetical protein